VVAFNTAEGWARDVTAEVARQVLTCGLELDHELPAAVRDLVGRACDTRKSTEYNVELAFNSLDAQREACEADIRRVKRTKAGG
jgi:hypothetical protein